MKIKKFLSAFVTSIMIITAFSLPVSAAASLTFSPTATAATYRLKVTASVDIMPTQFNINDTLSIKGKVLAGETISVSTPGKSNFSGTLLGDDLAPRLNNSPITQKDSLVFGFSSGTPNTIIGGTVSKFSWTGYVELSEKNKHPVNDLGLVMNDLKLGDDVIVDLPFSGGTSSVTLSNVVGEVVTPTAVTNGFEPGSQIKITDCFGNGKGLTFAQRKEISTSTSKNFSVTIKFDKAITDDFVLFTLTTDLLSTTVPVTSTKGNASLKFTVPRDYFYDANYDVLFSWLKITSTSTAYKYSSIVLEYDSTGTDVTDTTPTTSNNTADDDDEYDEELRINYTSVSLNVGASVNLATNYDDVSWTSSSSATVRAFASGKITAVKTGTATITGTNGNGDTVKCKVTVVSSKTPVTTIKLSKKSGTAYRNSSYAIGNMLSVSPSKHTDKITWSSDNTDIATVSSSGKVKVVGTGDVTITVTSSSGESASILLKCKQPTVKLSKTSATISVGKTTTIGVTSLPSASAITFDSYDEGVATVDEDGVVRGVKAGTADIRVRNKNGASATFKVTVK